MDGLEDHKIKRCVSIAGCLGKMLFGDVCRCCLEMLFRLQEKYQTGPTERTGGLVGLNLLREKGFKSA